MKRFFIFILIASLMTLNTNAAYSDYLSKSYNEMPYRIYIPPDYDENISYPLVLYLHGAGERGDDNTRQLLFGATYYLLSTNFIYNNPAIIIAPQCPEEAQWVNADWSLGSYSTEDIPETDYMKNVFSLLEKTIADYSIDTSRLYVTGLSMGGYATWDILIRHPHIFAAAVPICGAGDPLKASLLSDVAIWAFHGDEDQIVPFSGSYDMSEAIKASGHDNLRFTVYKGCDHNAWDITYSNTDVFEWMFDQGRTQSQTVEKAHHMYLITFGISLVPIILCIIVLCKKRTH